MNKYLDFQYAGDSDSGKTKRYHVVNKVTRDYLGGIHWKGNWRKYVFTTNGTLILDANCLKELAAFINKEMLNRKNTIAIQATESSPSASLPSEVGKAMT